MRPTRAATAVVGVAAALTGTWLIAARYRLARLDANLPSADRQVLEHGEQFTVYSLYPGILPFTPPKLLSKGTFHGHAILGRAVIHSTGVRQRLLNAIYGTIGLGERAGCFNPRHGIRAAMGHETVDLVPCFECGNVLVTDGTGERLTSIERTPKEVFDRVLVDAGVPLSTD